MRHSYWARACARTLGNYLNKLFNNDNNVLFELSWYISGTLFHLGASCSWLTPQEITLSACLENSLTFHVECSHLKPTLTHLRDTITSSHPIWFPQLLKTGWKEMQIYKQQQCKDTNPKPETSVNANVILDYHHSPSQEPVVLRRR